MAFKLRLPAVDENFRHFVSDGPFVNERSELFQMSHPVVATEVCGDTGIPGLLYIQIKTPHALDLLNLDGH